jgi:hypothetical protein
VSKSIGGRLALRRPSRGSSAGVALSPLIGSAAFASAGAAFAPRHFDAGDLGAGFLGGFGGREVDGQDSFAATGLRDGLESQSG